MKMNRARVMAWIRNKSKSPLWTPLAVLVSILAIAVPFVVGYFIGTGSKPLAPRRLIIDAETRKEIIEFSEGVSARTRVLIDGKEEQDLRLFVFRIQYKGQEPLRPGDFAGPIRGTTPRDRKLLMVRKASNLEGPNRYDPESKHMVADSRLPIEFDVKIIDPQNFEISPTLMNPDEWFGVEIYTSASQFSTSEKSAQPLSAVQKYDALSSEITWSCHVAGVNCPGRWDPDVDFAWLGLNRPWFLQVHLIHQAWGVYALVLFTTLNLVVLVSLAKQTPLSGSSGAIQVALIAVATPISFCVGEMLTHWLVNEYPFSIEQQWWFRLIFWINILIVLLLASLIKKKPLTTKK